MINFLQTDKSKKKKNKINRQINADLCSAVLILQLILPLTLNRTSSYLN